MPETATATIAQPIHDTSIFTPAMHRRPMAFRTRIYENPPFTVALLTDIGDANPGCSITNGIEYAVAAVLEHWPELNPARLVIVEHYDDREKLRQIAAKYRRMVVYEQSIGRENGESFALVGFRWRNAPTDWHNLNLPGEPHWKATTKAEVEELIGGALP